MKTLNNRKRLLIRQDHRNWIIGVKCKFPKGSGARLFFPYLRMEGKLTISQPYEFDAEIFLPAGQAIYVSGKGCEFVIYKQLHVRKPTAPFFPKISFPSGKFTATIVEKNKKEQTDAAKD